MYQSYWPYSRDSRCSSGMQGPEVLCKRCFHGSRHLYTLFFKHPSPMACRTCKCPNPYIPQESLLVLDTASRVRWLIKESILTSTWNMLHPWIIFSRRFKNNAYSHPSECFISDTWIWTCFSTLILPYPHSLTLWRAQSQSLSISRWWGPTSECSPQLHQTWRSSPSDPSSWCPS